MKRSYKKATKKVIARRRSERLTGEATTTFALANNSQQLLDSSEVIYHEDHSTGTDMDVE